MKEEIFCMSAITNVITPQPMVRLPPCSVDLSSPELSRTHCFLGDVVFLKLFHSGHSCLLKGGEACYQVNAGRLCELIIRFSKAEPGLWRRVVSVVCFPSLWTFNCVP